MTKTKSTKRALLMSALAMVLCVSMLIGTTFAWFTDSVTSSNNRIVAGNLDIELYYQNDETNDWVQVDSNTNIFKDPTETLWEPGHTEVVKLKIVNEGSLALKYQLGVNIASEIGSINVEGNPFKLSDYIYFGIAEGEQDYANRDVAIQAVKANASLIKEGYSKSSSLEKDAEAYLTMVVYMPATVGNEANYAKDQVVPEINLGLNLYATQFTSESDSFDNLYDEESVYADAYVTSVADLQEAIAAGGTVALMEDLTIDNTNAFTVAKGTNATINLNGHEIVATSVKDNGNQSAITVKGDLSIVGNGVVTAKHTGANMGWNALVAAFSVEGGSLTLGEGVVVAHEGGSDMAYAVDVNSTLGNATLTVDGAIITSPYTAVRLFNNHKTAKATVNYVSGYIDGVKRDIWVQNPSANAVDANGVVNIAEAYVYTMSVQDTSYNSRIYQFTGFAVVTDTDALTEALEGGKDVVLMADVNTTASAAAPYGNKVAFVHNGGVLDGNGNTIRIDNSGDHYVVMTAGGTIKNLVVDAGFRGIMIMSPTEDVILDNVVSGGDVCYALNTGEGDGTHSLIITNSTFLGWSSIGTAVKDVSFTNCTFGQGEYYTNVYGRLVKPYVNAVFADCEFNSKFYIDLSQLGKDGDGNVLDPDAKIVLRNCTVNGVKLTAENWQQLIVAEGACGEGQISVELKDGSFLTASNLADYVIIE